MTDTEEAKVLERVNKLPSTLPGMNMKMQTGIIVDFRTREVLRDKMEEGAFSFVVLTAYKEWTSHILWAKRER